MKTEAFEQGYLTTSDVFRCMTLGPYDIKTALLKLIAPIRFLWLFGIQPSCVDGLPDEEEWEVLTFEWYK